MHLDKPICTKFQLNLIDFIYIIYEFDFDYLTISLCKLIM